MACVNGTVCIGGKGFQSRAASTTSMFMEAVGLLMGRGVHLRNFTRVEIDISDTGGNCKGGTFTYTTCTAYPPGFCTQHMIPDFTMWAFTEARLLPNFTGLTEKLHGIGQRAPRRRKCGFAGSTQTHKQRAELYERQQQPDVAPLLEFVAADHIYKMERWSMEKQTEEWACLIDIQGQGYSGRGPMLLHTGRPMLLVESARRMWYSKWLEPGVHYIPVKKDYSDLVPALQKALSKEGEAIGRNGQRLAMANLTTERSVEYIADLLATLFGA